MDGIQENFTNTSLKSLQRKVILFGGLLCREMKRRGLVASMQSYQDMRKIKCKTRHEAPVSCPCHVDGIP